MSLGSVDGIGGGSWGPYILALVLDKYKMDRISPRLHFKKTTSIFTISPLHFSSSFLLNTIKRKVFTSIYNFIMQFKHITAVFLASLIGAQSAAIISRDQISQQEQEPEQALVLLSSEVIPAGNLTIWGVPDTGIPGTPDTVDDVASPHVDRRCGSNQVTCHTSNQAYTTVCSALIGTLGGSGVGTAPRSICLSQSGNQCCISWGNPVPSLVQSNLYNAANSARNRCGSSGLVSAIVADTNLHGICTNQCLSNRPDGCPSA